jgi:hypothetical protein
MKGRSGDLAREVVVTCDFCGSPDTEEVEIQVGGRRVVADMCPDDRRDRTLDEILDRGKMVVLSMRSTSNRALDARIRA